MTRLNAALVMAVSLLVLVIASCTSADRNAEGVPSQAFDAPAAGFEAAADSARKLARSRVVRRHLPGVSIAVGRGGELVWAEGFGWANLSSNELVTPETQYRIGSISKPLTAVAVARLYEEGRIDLDASIHQYLPDFPEKRWPMTVRQVMGHIAGIRDFGMIEALRTEGCANVMEGLKDFSADTLEFEPGEDYQYANFGYNMVGAIVESITGEPFLDHMELEVFDALGLHSTSTDFNGEGLPALATPYDYGAYNTSRQSQDADMSCHMPAGGYVSTPSDLVRFANSMLGAEVLAPETIAEFWTPLELNDGEPTNYGLGWQLNPTRLGDDDRPTPTIGHGGRVFGGRASLIILPESGTVVAVTTNHTSGDITRLARSVAALFRPKPTEDAQD